LLCKFNLYRYIMAWRWMQPPTAAAAEYDTHPTNAPPSEAAASPALAKPPARPVKAPVLVSKLLGHTQAGLALFTTLLLCVETHSTDDSQ
jgi:hypothetical protein